MATTRLLRLEGLAVFLAATGSFVALDGAWWLYLLLVLLPDLGMVGYLAGPRVGSWTYNAVHLYAGPLALAGAGLAFAVELAVLGGLVWAAHIGADRALGYGLKEPTGFGDTHLGSL
ncbi:DUF4260 domain-containing protein [Halobacterium wangiae]|uniref:DUF4260 domain-containing protein n=1 Tax=Halobacterium wangiae TaxID=2902623 RepID=UPI001E315ADD|nr:DUF4260 domain-containing protein [Halobacterium wangiae]